jgi:predicted dehydrogenase
MKQPPPLRVATAGAGYFSRFQYAAWDRIPEVDVVAICNRSVGPAKELAAQYDIADIYQDFARMLDESRPDLVDIITPPTTHVEYVRAAVERDIPVICQKPFTASLTDARALVGFIEARNAQVVIHENFRFQPWYQKIRQVLAQGTLGQLYQISFALRPGDGQGPEAYLDRQPYFQDMERFLVHETAVHLIDVFRYLFGEVSSVFADLRQFNPVIRGEDAGLIIFDFDSGARGLFDGNRLSDHKAENRRLTMGEMRIEGENGTLSLTGDAEIYFRKHGQNEDVRLDYDWQNVDYGGDCVFNFQRHVVDHSVHGTELVNTAREYLTNVEIVEACYLSSDREMKVRPGTD